MPRRSAFDRRAVEKLLRAYRAAYEASDVAALHRLHHPGGADNSDDDYDASLMKRGFRVASARIAVYQRPNWSVFKLFDFHPPPVCSVRVVLKNAAGDKEEQFLACAPRGQEYRICFYKPKEADPRSKARRQALDLRKDADELKQLLAKAVERYSTMHKHPKAGAAYPPVTGIGLIFSCQENADVSVCFDTRPAFAPDGRWTHRDVIVLRRPRWEAAWDALAAVEVKVRMPDGSPIVLAVKTEAKDFARPLGDLLVRVLKTARQRGVFKKLPRGKRCELCVEETGGHYGWPRYEDRGKGNLV